jgi:hypothetical protein
MGARFLIAGFDKIIVSAQDDGEAMPTLLVEKGFRFYFYSRQGDEPPHVHVDRSGNSAKFWLANVTCARAGGFAPVELRRIERIIASNRGRFLRKWNEYFKTGL